MKFFLLSSLLMATVTSVSSLPVIDHLDASYPDLASPACIDSSDGHKGPSDAKTISQVCHQDAALAPQALDDRYNGINNAKASPEARRDIANAFFNAAFVRRGVWSGGVVYSKAADSATKRITKEVPADGEVAIRSANYQPGGSV